MLGIFLFVLRSFLLLSKEPVLCSQIVAEWTSFYVVLVHGELSKSKYVGRILAPL